jgi:hypothetical protein
MWYLITGLICVFLIWNNNKDRNASITKYAIISILLPPLGYGFWQAEKPLINEEKRYGGRGWNILKWFAIIHTIMCVVWAFYGMFIGAKIASESGSDAGKVGAAIGTGLGIMMIMAVWFFGVMGSLVLGLIVKKPIVEEASK